MLKVEIAACEAMAAFNLIPKKSAETIRKKAAFNLSQINEFERIKQTYDKQCESMMSYVDMIDNLRTVVYQNIRGLNGTPSLPPTNEQSQSPLSVPIRQQQVHQAEPLENNLQAANNSEQEAPESTGKRLMQKIHGTTKKTIQHAEESLSKLDNVLEQLRRNMQKK